MEPSETLKGSVAAALVKISVDLVIDVSAKLESMLCGFLF